MKKKALIILSGGLDSTVLAHDIVARGKKELAAVSFDYGQKHRRELECAAAQAKILGIEHTILPLPFINDLFDSALLQSGGTLPEGHYEDDNMKQTVVPNRNMIMLSIAAGLAISQGRTELFYGAHGGDHAIYPDCRPAFVEAMKEVLALCDWQKLKLHVPFLHDNKAQIVALGQHLKVDFARTWTCYAGKERPCGKCGSCVERREAFALNKLQDPLF